MKTKLNYCLLGQVLFFFLLSYFLTFEPSLYLAYHVVLLYFLFVAVFIIEEFHTLLTVCPRHREKCGVGWRTGKVRCSIPSEFAGHKSSSAKGDRGISSKESAFVLIAGETFVPVGTRKKINEYGSTVVVCSDGSSVEPANADNSPPQILFSRKLPWKCFCRDRMRSLVTSSLRGYVIT